MEVDGSEAGIISEAMEMKNGRRRHISNQETLQKEQLLSLLLLLLS
jgi:hypothetical protein